MLFLSKTKLYLELFIAFKKAYSCCFSPGANLDLLEFYQKIFIRSITGRNMLYTEASVNTVNEIFRRITNQTE